MKKKKKKNQSGYKMWPSTKTVANRIRSIHNGLSAKQTHFPEFLDEVFSGKVDIPAVLASKAYAEAVENKT